VNAGGGHDGAIGWVSERIADCRNFAGYREIDGHNMKISTRLEI
jgi:hypothetical protein